MPKRELMARELLYEVAAHICYNAAGYQSLNERGRAKFKRIWPECEQEFEEAINNALSADIEIAQNEMKGLPKSQTGPTEIDQVIFLVGIDSNIEAKSAKAKALGGISITDLK